MADHGPTCPGDRRLPELLLATPPRRQQLLGAGDRRTRRDCRLDRPGGLLGLPIDCEESRFWTPLTFALNLLVGNIQECSVGPDARPAPLALQLPRLLGPLLLVIAAFGIVASIFRAQSDRILVRLSRSVVVLVGLTRDAMPLVRRLSTEREADTTLAVLVSDPGNREAPLRRTAGAGCPNSGFRPAWRFGNRFKTSFQS